MEANSAPSRSVRGLDLAHHFPYPAFNDALKMDARFLLGPAGSGKTFRCLWEIRDRLIADPLGPPLVFIAPRQATYQLELQLLSDPKLAGYSRLQILSFERLGAWLFDQLEQAPNRALSEEGRIMVLRAILHQHHASLQTFGSSSRLSGFAGRMSEQLRELQQHRTTPKSLRQAAARLSDEDDLRRKLNDLAIIQEAYRDWLERGNVSDAGTQLDQLVESLRTDQGAAPAPSPFIEELWLDGIAELTPQELELIAALVPHVRRATFAFCLDSVPDSELPWLSNWAIVGQTFRKLHNRLSAEADCEITVEPIRRFSGPSRFHHPTTPTSGSSEQLDMFNRSASSSAGPRHNSPILQFIENHWTSGATAEAPPVEDTDELTLVACQGPEQEAINAAREIIRFVRAGNRFRDCAVLMRQLETHAASLRRAFTRYQIPYFMDRRESVAHHPLAELTRCTLLTLLYHWRITDWFGVLKSGLTELTDAEVDSLETLSLAHGWEGSAWFQPLNPPGHEAGTHACEHLRRRIIEPFQSMRHLTQSDPSGPQLADALRTLWEKLDVETTLQDWSESSEHGSVHLTVHEEMLSWLDDLELAFANVTMPLRDWIPILDSGLDSLSVGVIPPAIDQVIVGAVDRSRNPEIKLGLVLGMNEGLCPRPVVDSGLLSANDRLKLEGTAATLQTDTKARIGHERFLAYIALTRAHERLLVSWSERDSGGQPLNVSPFVDQLRRLLPGIPVRHAANVIGLEDVVHERELLTPLLDRRQILPAPSSDGNATELQDWIAHFEQFERHVQQERLSPDTIKALHGNNLRASASRLENFAACPFQYFATATLRAKERLRFEVDARKTGTFVHEVLRRFHLELEREHLRWRDLDASDARKRVARLAAETGRISDGGVLAAGERNRFQLNITSRLLQDFVAQSIEWMRCYQFDPIAVELSIGSDADGLPPWEIPLDDERALVFRGQVDRVDAAIPADNPDQICLSVMDYKSGRKKFAPWEMQSGLQLQLPAYLAALCNVAEGYNKLDGRKPVPAGMFYIRLKRAEIKSRSRAPESGKASNKPFEHSGRFSLERLPLFDSESTGDSSGQFAFKLTKEGLPNKNYKDLVPQSEFESIVANAERMLKVMGREILNGNIAVDPYRKGNQLPCTYCEFKSVCRIDPWTHVYRPPRPLLESDRAED